jgi:DNA-binding CsgD family transcriptional regulator
MASYVSVAAAADLLHVSAATVRRWLGDGLITGAKVGSTWVVDAESLNVRVGRVGPRQSATEASSRVALGHLRAGDFRDPWVPDVLRHADALHHPDPLTRQAAALIEADGPWPDPIAVDVPRSGFLSRPASQLEPLAAVVYQTVVESVAAAIDRQLGDNVYSARLASQGAALLRPGTAAWLRWREAASAEVRDGRPWLVKTDITAYFDNIEHRILFRDLDSLGADVTHVRALKSMLSDWALSPGRGLPQGQDASRVLANLYLVPVDQTMATRNVGYSRFMDDLRLFATTRAEAVRELRLLERTLRQRGLSLSGQKTELLYHEAALADLSSDDDMDAATYAIASGAGEASAILARLLRASLRQPGMLDDRRARFALWRLRSGRDTSQLRTVLRELDRLGSVARITAQYLVPHVRLPWVVERIEAFLIDAERNTSPVLATWLLAALLDQRIEPSAKLAPYLRALIRDPAEPIYLRSIATSCLAISRMPGDLATFETGLRQTHDPHEARANLVALARAGALTAHVRKLSQARFPLLARTIEYLIGREVFPSLVYDAPRSQQSRRLAAALDRSAPTPLTPRERELIGLISRSRSNGEIAAELGVSVKAVEAGLARLFTKFEVATRTELAVLAALRYPSLVRDSPTVNRRERVNAETSAELRPPRGTERRERRRLRRDCPG